MRLLLLTVHFSSMKTYLTEFNNARKLCRIILVLIYISIVQESPSFKVITPDYICNIMGLFEIDKFVIGGIPYDCNI